MDLVRRVPGVVNLLGGHMRKFTKAAISVVAVASLFVIGNPGSLWASFFTVPEIDPSSGMAAMALLAGTVLVIRGRMKK